MRAATVRLAALTTVALLAVAACDADTKPTETKDTTMPSTTPAPDYPLNQPVMVTPDNFVVVRQALLTLASTLPSTAGAFGPRDKVDPINHLIGSASAWGGNPPEDAEYLTVTPGRNDGNTIYRLRVKDVPVEGFWSISVYNAAGQFQPNSANAYTVDNVTAKAEPDRTVDIQFGGCNPTVLNCLPIEPGWNYMVRLYRPQAPILNGQWTFPEATPVS
ncbi:DUF1214 domain-containing protein [Nocardia sp. NBC_00511]|uniref:DUF1214 domain-containing protein n=1 Tax=Nocardia sp. NBC_00511 TaxID=2903591 RepID=UPI0030E3E6F1